MANSMLPSEIGVVYIESDYQSGSSDTFCFLNLFSLQNMVELMGDGWTAENISSDANTLHWISPNSSESLALKSGKSIPMIKNTALYPNLGICFPCVKSWYDRAQLVTACVINLATGEALSSHLLTNVNVDILFMDVYSFSATAKAVGGSTERGQESSGIIFTAQGIITSKRLDSGDVWDYRIILPDGTYSDTTVQNPILQSARTVFEPIFGENFANVVFDGIYLLTRCDVKTYRVVTYSGITYTIFGTNRVDWSDHKQPVFVVSSEILG